VGKHGGQKPREPSRREPAGVEETLMRVSNRREPLKRYSQRVIINTHLGAWRGVDDAPVYLLTGEETNLGSSL
jgi:hypothetical protein